MIMAADKQDKVLNFSSEREQSGACSSSAEHEKNQGKNFLNVPTLRFPEFTGNWEKTKLADITKRVLRKNKGVVSERPLTISAQYGLIDQRDFFNKVVASENLEGYYLLKKGEFAYNKSYSNEYPWGAVKRLDSYDEGALSTLYICFECIGVDGDWLVHYFDSPKWNGQVSAIAVEGARNHGLLNVGIEDFFGTQHFVPNNKKEQKKIATFLNLIDERISTQIRIINEIQSLISGITQKISKHSSIRMTMLSELLVERNEKNTALFPVHSVSVSEGVINQIDYLGRSFAAADTSHYNVAHKGDIIYTKSPTGEFPFGIVKRNAIESNVAVSPLYGVYKPVTDNVAIYLHYYFCSPLNAQNYLHKLIQKGAKNTINITNQRFLENCIPLPENKTLSRFVKLISAVSTKLKLEKSLLETLQRQKRYLLTSMFI